MDNEIRTWLKNIEQAISEINRNRIIHGYDSVSEDILWGIIIRNLPTLDGEVKELLK